MHGWHKCGQIRSGTFSSGLTLWAFGALMTCANRQLPEVGKDSSGQGLDHFIHSLPACQSTDPLIEAACVIEQVLPHATNCR